MIKFEFRKESLIITPQVMLFKPFVDIIESDKSSSKLKSNKMFLYIFFMCDLTEDNPIRDSYDNKHKEAMFRAFGNNSKIKLTKADKALIQNGVECYIKYNETSEERALEVFDSKAAELRKAIDIMTPETAENSYDGVVSFVTNSKIISTGLAELASIHKKRDVIVASIRREALMTRVRGQMKLSPLSKGEITLYRDADASLYRKGLINKDEAEVIQRESLSRLDSIKSEQIRERLKAVEKSG